MFYLTAVGAKKVKFWYICFSDSPVLWIRLDPEMILLRNINIEQPDFQWQFQLKHERDVTAQFEAIIALEKYPSTLTRQTLTTIIENDLVFYRVRCEAAYCLSKVKTMLLTNLNVCYRLTFKIY